MPAAESSEERDSLTRNFLQHLGIGWELLHEHEQTLYGFVRFVASKASSDEVDFLQFPLLEQQLFATGTGKEDVHSGINAQVADLAIEHQLHVTGAFEFLKNQFIHSAAGFD